MSKKKFKLWINKVSNVSHKDRVTCLGGFRLLNDFCQHGIYLKYIREEKNVLISVYRNGSGYLWSMELNDSGTNLGYSEYSGDCKNSGTFTTYQKAMEDAIILAMSNNLEDFRKDSRYGGHWSNYALYLISKR